MVKRCDKRHRSVARVQVSFHQSTLEGTMRKLILLIATTAMFLCSISVWAGGSRTETTDDAAVFVISNAL